jgi:hypothetical protein
MTHPAGGYAQSGAKPIRETVRSSPLSRVAAVLLAAVAALVACPAASSADRPDPHDRTLVLRDLAASLPALRGAERAAAERALARPPDQSNPLEPGWATDTDMSICTEHVCIHWVETGADAPLLTDDDGSGVPDWVETTALVFEQVWSVEVDRFGYRPPLSDEASTRNGGDGRLDVYLADVGADGYFGWCATDDPAVNATRRVSAFCVIDDDYANPIYRLPSPLEALQVTAAHEFFHAIQFGYDWLEDLWLMEGTAVWMEDEVYDDVNDCLRYLRSDSPLMRPDVPIDQGRGGYEYGAWIFWRYLSERLGPGIVRSVWRRAAQREDGNPFSLAATTSVLQGRGRSFTRMFAGFGVANRIPERGYREGGRYPAGKGAPALELGSAHPTSGPRTLVLRHLSNRTVSFRPGGGTNALRLTVDLGRRGRVGATAIVVHSSGDVSVRRLPLDAAGRGAVEVPFVTGSVRRVELVLTNAETRFECWRGTALSCGGVSRHDRLRFDYRADALWR